MRQNGESREPTNMGRKVNAIRCCFTNVWIEAVRLGDGNNVIWLISQPKMVTLINT